MASAMGEDVLVAIIETPPWTEPGIRKGLRSPLETVPPLHFTCQIKPESLLHILLAKPLRTFVRAGVAGAGGGDPCGRPWDSLCEAYHIHTMPSFIVPQGKSMHTSL